MTNQMTISAKRIIWQVQVNPGKYVLGDPCYCFPNHDLWLALGESCVWFEDSPVGMITFNGTTYNVLGFHTKYGDGTYGDNQGNQYPVDAGLLGLVPLELAEALGVEFDADLHQIVEFKHGATCTCDDGDMWFGGHHINTSDDEDNDYSRANSA